MSMNTQTPRLSDEPWSVGLCDCFSNCGRFCISCWCPCITFGQVSEIIDGSSCCVNGGLYFLLMALLGCGWLCSCVYRGKMRKRLKLQGGSCGDCFRHLCCEPCALTQMYCELQHRGMAAAMAPPTTHPGMNR